MKKIFLSIIIMAVSFSMSAQNEKFIKAMTANFEKLDSAKEADDFLSVSASFERIANAEKNQWLAYYYAAYTQVIYGFVKQDAQAYDAIADKAEALLNKADSLQKDNSEVSTIRSMIATLHMLVNPYQRYMQYGAASAQALEDAKIQDPTNPRPVFLQAQTLKNTPKQFGGGCEVAKPVMESALKLFETFKPASELHPTWGKRQTQDLLKECN